ncbi:MAG: molybdate ABC transporter substrate-binding protein [Pseudomonadota bacterium]
MRLWGILFLITLWSHAASSEEVRVAVSSNFLTTAEKIAEAFERATGHEVILSNGSTGLLFAQISAGAPFDVFLSADAERPRRLLADGRALETRAYAIGAVALLSTEPVSAETAQQHFADKTVALADPTVAPYGRAATRAMEALSLDTATFRPVMVSNVAQVASVFATGNADLAFVAVAQLAQLDAPHVLPLDGIAPPIRQEAALLVDAPAPRAFWEWLQRDDTAALIVAEGYETP